LRRPELLRLRPIKARSTRAALVGGVGSVPTDGP
jgi:hypothetical protein